MRTGESMGVVFGTRRERSTVHAPTGVVAASGGQVHARNRPLHLVGAPWQLNWHKLQATRAALPLGRYLAGSAVVSVGVEVGVVGVR